MLLFFCFGPIALIILLILYGTSFFRENKIRHVLFIILFNMIFIVYCLGAYELCLYSSNIRLNGKIKTYLNSLVQTEGKSIPPVPVLQPITAFPGSAKQRQNYFLLLLCTAFLFIALLTLLYFLYHKKYLRYAIGILSLFCMYLMFIVIEKSIDYCNDYCFSVEAQKIKAIIKNNPREMRNSIFYDKLKTAISRFNAPYYYGETPISRLNLLQSDIIRWSNPETKHADDTSSREPTSKE